MSPAAISALNEGCHFHLPERKSSRAFLTHEKGRDDSHNKCRSKPACGSVRFYRELLQGLQELFGLTEEQSISSE